MFAMSASAASQLSSIPSNLLSQLPAGPPPPGKDVNLTHGNPVGNTLMAVEIVLFQFLVLMFGVRIYVKKRITGGWWWDDLACALSMIGAVVNYCVGFIAFCHGPLGNHVWNVSLEEVIQAPWIRATYVMSIVSTPALACAKISLLLMYYQLFWPFRWLRIAVYIWVPVFAAFYLGASISQIILLAPRHGETSFEHLNSPQEQQASSLYGPIAGVGLGIDIWLLVLPVRCISQLQMPMRKKLGCILIFGTGVFACVASSLNLYGRTMLHSSTDVLYWSGLAQFFMYLELWAGIACTCMPSMAKVFSYHLPAARSCMGKLTPKHRSAQRLPDEEYELDYPSHSVQPSILSTLPSRC